MFEVLKVSVKSLEYAAKFQLLIRYKFFSVRSSNYCKNTINVLVPTIGFIFFILQYFFMYSFFSSDHSVWFTTLTNLTGNIRLW